MFAELLAHPGVVEEMELGSAFGFMALHGGSVERETAEIAREAAARSGASIYSVMQPEDLWWHIPSVLADPAASPALEAFLEHVDVVVSIHGYGRPDGHRSLLLGGANRTLAAAAADTLRPALPGYVIVDDLDAIPPALRGLHPANPVNRPRGGGVQLELPGRVRSRRLPDRAALVDALATLARCM
jgi:phage replication-related protein YjqB (UPF0714/DUF867 family)